MTSSGEPVFIDSQDWKFFLPPIQVESIWVQYISFAQLCLCRSYIVLLNKVCRHYAFTGRIRRNFFFDSTGLDQYRFIIYKLLTTKPRLHHGLIKGMHVCRCASCGGCIPIFPSKWGGGQLGCAGEPQDRNVSQWNPPHPKSKALYSKRTKQTGIEKTVNKTRPQLDGQIPKKPSLPECHTEDEDDGHQNMHRFFFAPNKGHHRLVSCWV